MSKEKEYSERVLQILMGAAHGDRSEWRFDRIGKPESEQDEDDEGLALLELRPDGVYVKPALPPRFDEIAIDHLTGDLARARKQQRPVLPLPFTLTQLRRVEGGALGIVERLSCGEDIEHLFARLGNADPDAEEIARRLLDSRTSRCGNGATSDAGGATDGYPAPCNGESNLADAFNSPLGQRTLQLSTETAGRTSGEYILPRGRRLKRNALIGDNIRRWPTIERDLKDAAANGLSAAAKDSELGWWWEGSAQEWARARGKYQGTSTSVRAQNSVFGGHDKP